MSIWLPFVAVFFWEGSEGLGKADEGQDFGLDVRRESSQFRESFSMG